MQLPLTALEKGPKCVRPQKSNRFLQHHLSYAVAHISCHETEAMLPLTSTNMQDPQGNWCFPFWEAEGSRQKIKNKAKHTQLKIETYCCLSRRVGKNCYTVKIFLCTKILGRRQTRRRIMTQAWHSDCASMGRKSDLGLSKEGCSLFTICFLCLFCPSLCLGNRNCLVPFYFFISNLFPTLSIFQGHNIALLSPLPGE